MSSLVLKFFYLQIIKFLFLHFFFQVGVNRGSVFLFRLKKVHPVLLAESSYFFQSAQYFFLFVSESNACSILKTHCSDIVIRPVPSLFLSCFYITLSSENFDLWNIFEIVICHLMCICCTILTLSSSRKHESSVWVQRWMSWPTAEATRCCQCKSFAQRLWYERTAASSSAASVCEFTAASNPVSSACTYYNHTKQWDNPTRGGMLPYLCNILDLFEGLKLLVLIKHFIKLNTEPYYMLLLLLRLDK